MTLPDAIADCNAAGWLVVLHQTPDLWHATVRKLNERGAVCAGCTRVDPDPLVALLDARQGAEEREAYRKPLMKISLVELGLAAPMRRV